MKKTLALCLVIINLILLLTFGAQGTGTSAKPAMIPTNIPKTFPAVQQDSTYTTVTFWHSMAGRNEWWVNNLIIWFNSTVGREKKIYVKGVYQGEYGMGYINLARTLQSNASQNSDNKVIIEQLPDIAQLNSSLAGVAYYFDITLFVRPSETLLTLEDLLISEKQMWVKEKLNPNAAAACSFKGKLVGLPFGSEMMGLHYNADAFKAVGLDPANPPKTLEEYAKAAGKLVIKDSAGKVKRYGAAGLLDVRLLSTWIPRMKDGSGGQFDMNDGRTGVPQKFIANQEDSLQRVLTEWKKLLDTGANDSKVYTNYQIRQQFENGGATMYMASTVNMEGTLSRFAAEKNKTKKFDARLARLPKLTAEDAPGQTIGGYGLYLFKNGDEERKKAAFEFIKFAASVDASAYFTANSGYYPTNTDAMNMAYVQDALKKNPHRKLSFDLLTESASNTKAQEPFYQFGESYDKTIGEQSALMSNKLTPEQAAANITKKTNRILDLVLHVCR